MEIITRGPGVELAATRSGAGPTVLLIGGLGMPTLVWDLCGLTQSLVSAGFSVIAYDARGLTPSSAPPAPYSMADLAGDADAVLDHFDVDSAIVVGYSMGCYTAQTMLRGRAERVRAAALVGGLQPTPFNAIVGRMELSLIERYGAVPPEVLAFEQLVTTLHPAMLQDPVAVAEWHALLLSNHGGWAGPDGFAGQLAASQEWLEAGEPVPAALAAIAVPTLVLAFEHDLFFPPEPCAQAARLIPGAEFRQVDGVGHGGLMLGAGETVALIVDFCRAQEAG